MILIMLLLSVESTAVFFRISRSAFSFTTSRLSRAISNCSGFI